jgi:hypothetical protein
MSKMCFSDSLINVFANSFAPVTANLFAEGKDLKPCKVLLQIYLQKEKT